MPYKKQHVGLVLLRLISSWTSYLASSNAQASERLFYNQIQGQVQQARQKVTKFITENEKVGDKGKGKDPAFGDLGEEEDESERRIGTVYSGARREMEAEIKAIGNNEDRLKRFGATVTGLVFGTGL